MSEKIKLEYQSDIFFYKCASVGDDWEEKYADNENVLALISKLLSVESQDDDGVSELMEELISEIGGDEETQLLPCGSFTLNDESLPEEENEDGDLSYEVDEDGDLTLESDFKSVYEIYDNQINSSKICVVEEAQNKRHTAELEIEGPFDINKLEYKDGWIQYDGESFESDGMSEGNAIDRILYVDGKNPGSLDYIVRVEDGKIVIPSVYCELLDLSEGQEYEIKLGRKAIRLIPVEDDD